MPATISKMFIREGLTVNRKGMKIRQELLLYAAVWTDGIDTSVPERINAIFLMKTESINEEFERLVAFFAFFFFTSLDMSVF